MSGLRGDSSAGERATSVSLLPVRVAFPMNGIPTSLG